jgi:hypothetical protein
VNGSILDPTSPRAIRLSIFVSFHRAGSEASFRRACKKCPDECRDRASGLCPDPEAGGIGSREERPDSDQQRGDSFARTGLRDWLRNVEAREGPGQAIRVNRRLYGPAGGGAYRTRDFPTAEWFSPLRKKAHPAGSPRGCVVLVEALHPGRPCVAAGGLPGWGSRSVPPVGAHSTIIFMANFPATVVPVLPPRKGRHGGGPSRRVSP